MEKTNEKMTPIEIVGAGSVVGLFASFIAVGVGMFGNRATEEERKLSDKILLGGGIGLLISGIGVMIIGSIAKKS